MPPDDPSNKLRVPMRVLGLQVNFCRNMECGRFGTLGDTRHQKRGPGNSAIEGESMKYVFAFQNLLDINAHS